MAQDASNRSLDNLPEGVREWVSALAEEDGVTEEDILARIFESGSGEASVPEKLDAEIESLESTVSDLEERIAELDTELDTKIDDVRERVIQVKRATDQKAEEDHEHPDIGVRIDNLDEEIGDLTTEVGEIDADLDSARESLRTDIDDLGERLDDRVADLTDKVEILAVTLIGVRDRVQSLIAAQERKRHLEDLQGKANRAGARAASCENCSERVEIGLLTDARCPHCNESFEDLAPKDGFFGSNVLETGEPPALEGEIDVDEDELEGIVED